MRSRRAINFAVALLLAGAGLVASFAVVATAPAGTAEVTGSDSTSTDTTTTEPTTTAPFTIPDNVTIGGVAVDGMTLGAAQATVDGFFTSPLALRIGKQHISLDPSDVGAEANIQVSLDLAELAQPGDRIPLDISVNDGLLAKYVKKLSARFDRAPKDARVFLRHLRPWVSDGQDGQKLKKSAATAAIRRALVLNRRFAVSLPLKLLPQHVSKKSFGPVIVIRRGSNRLYLYKGTHFWRRFPVATGQAVYPTPLGHYEIVVKWRNPWWYPPNSPWAQGEKPVPPGPGNPLGTRWMGLSASGVGIHGTPNSGSIGYSLSHGCIRMYISDAEWLFNHVEIGTQVFIIPQ
jgi:lipoprotein-anchoring transpeptidase ErfK/SrfK